MMSAIAAAAYNNLSVSAALPAIGDDLGNLDLLPWIITIELIASAVAVLAVGPIIDAVGTRTVFRWSLVLFAISSAACGLAPNVYFLIGARALQGLAVGAIIANVMAAIGLGVAEALRARAYAVNSSVWGVMGVGGPAIAALILTVAEWPAIFFVNLPVAVFAGFVGWNALPGPTEAAVRPDADTTGLAIVVAFILLSLGALSTLTWWTPLAALGALALVVVYVRYERTADAPVLRMRHVTGVEFRTLHVAAFLVISAGVCANTFLPIYVKGVRGASTAGAAFAVVFLTMGWTTGAMLSSRLSERLNGERAVVLSSAVQLVAVITATIGIALTAPLPVIFAGFFGVGFGMGGVSSAGIGLLQRFARPDEMGRVNSAHQFIRTLGFSFGAALGGALLFVTVKFMLGDADEVRSLLGEGSGDAVVDPNIVAALDRGFALSAAVGSVLAFLGFAAAVRLASASDELAGASAVTEPAA